MKPCFLVQWPASYKMKWERKVGPEGTVQILSSQKDSKNKYENHLKCICTLLCFMSKTVMLIKSSVWMIVENTSTFKISNISKIKLVCKVIEVTFQM